MKKLLLINVLLILLFSLASVSATNNITSDNDYSLANGEEIEIRDNIRIDYESHTSRENTITSENLLKSNPLNMTEEKSINDLNIFTEPPNPEKMNVTLILYTLNYIYPWTWIDSDGDSGAGIDISLYSESSEFIPTRNTTIYFDDEVITVNQGEFTTLIPEETLWAKYTGKGTHRVTAVYSGDENFNPANDSIEFVLSHYSCDISNTGIVTVELSPSISGCITVTVNGKSYTQRVTATDNIRYPGYEEYKFSLIDLKKNDTIKVDFKDNSDKYSFFETFRYIASCPIEICQDERDLNGGYHFPAEYYYGYDNLVELIVPKDIKNKVTVTIDGKSYSYTKIGFNNKDCFVYGDSNTEIVYKIDISDLKPGKHNITVSYPGDSKYDKYMKNETIAVYTGLERITRAEDITMQYGTSKTISLRIYDNSGSLVNKNHVVKIQIGKTTFKVQTAKNGFINFKIPNTVKPGKYSMTISYKNAKITKKLIVTQILSLKTVKVKKSAKSITLQANLAKVNGKYLAKKTITFKFNSKTYKAKTNAKGVAKYTIKKSVLSKLKTGKKITYQATYIKDTVKKSATIKK